MIFPSQAGATNAMITGDRIEPTKGNILIVDDMPNNLRFLSSALTGQGYKVRGAIDGRMALTVAKAAAPDLILLDIMMPEMDGYEVCQQLKTDEQTCEIPVIFISALDDTLDKVKAFGVGGVDYITKPFQVEEVLVRVENQLSLRAAQAEIRNLNATLEIRVLQRTAQLEKEIAERQRVQEQLLHLALHDRLTGLPNRAWLMKRLEQVLNRAQQEPGYCFAVLFLDCDNFKAVNDSLGHLAGDNLLIAVARRLESCLYPAYTIARLGGDEFVILLEAISGAIDATRVAEQIHQDLALPFHLGDRQIFINASIGIVLGSQAYEQPDHVLRDADTAMYRAKAKGKARYQIFKPEMLALARSFLELQTSLRLAIERQEFVVYYQPIVSLAAEQIAAFEALVRWQHPDRGLLPPAEFIWAAEEMGLIIDIDRWVLRQACRQLKLWQRRYPACQHLQVSVNLSAKQLSCPDLISYIDRVLHETQLEGESLKLEITESAIMDSDESATVVLQALKARRIQIGIDDFGTGYSSLSYLHRLTVDMLKIDRSFVSRIGTTGENLEIVGAIASLAHNLGMAVTAEGVETQQQLAQLRDLGCEFGQGYVVSQPLDSSEATAILTARSPEII